MIFCDFLVFLVIDIDDCDGCDIPELIFSRCTEYKYDHYYINYVLNFFILKYKCHARIAW